MIYDIDNYYTVSEPYEHSVDTKKYNRLSFLYYSLIVLMTGFTGFMYLSETESFFILIYLLFCLNIIVRMAVGLQYVRTGKGNLMEIFTNLENFAPGFYLKEKDKEIIECVDFEEVSEEETKKLFDSKKTVR